MKKPKNNHSNEVVNEASFSTCFNAFWKATEVDTTIKLECSMIDKVSKDKKFAHIFELSDFVAKLFLRLDRTIDIKQTRQDLMKVMIIREKFYFEVAGKQVGVSLHFIDGDEILKLDFESCETKLIHDALALSFHDYQEDKLIRKTLSSCYF